MVEPYYHPETGQLRCGSKTKLPNKFGEHKCLGRPMTNGRCRKHGGKTPKGAASPHFKTGEWSDHLPTKLAALYKETEHDAELLSTRRSIRLLDAMLITNFEKLDTGESGEAWVLIRQAVDKLEVAIDNQDYGRSQEAIRKMRDVIDMKVAHYATEAEIRSKLDQRRKLVETEQKITLQGERAISAEQLMLLMGVVLNVINNVVTDKQQRQQIIVGLEKVVSIGAD